MFDDLDYMRAAEGATGMGDDEPMSPLGARNLASGHYGNVSALQLGSSGDAVYAWSLFLVSRGLLSAPSTMFTPEVSGATSSYQIQNGLTPSGSVDSATMAKAQQQGYTAAPGGGAGGASQSWQQQYAFGEGIANNALDNILKIVGIGLAAEQAKDQGQLSPELLALQQRLATVQAQGPNADAAEIEALRRQAVAYEAEKARAATIRNVGLGVGVGGVVIGLGYALASSMRRGRGRRARRGQRCGCGG